MSNTNKEIVYYTIYQITNRLNSMIYIGCHKTKKINDSYMGSGTNIKSVIKQFGKENFTKDILFVYDNKEDMLDKEIELVNNDFISRPDTYNIILGGSNYIVSNCMTVKDNKGNTFMVHVTDARFLSGELISITTGKVSVKDKTGKIIQVDKTDSRFLSGELVGIRKGFITVKDKDGIFLSVSQTDSRFINGELISIHKDKVAVRDKNNKTFKISTNDPRYLSGELVHVGKGYKMTEEQKQKMSINHRNVSGKNNSAYGRTWIYSDVLNINKFIKKEDLEKFIYLGWKPGMIKKNNKKI